MNFQKTMRFSVVALLTLAMFGCRQSAPAASAPRASPPSAEMGTEAPADEILIEIAVGLIEAAPDVDELWPGIWPPARRVLLSPFRGGALLVGPYPESYSRRVDTLAATDPWSNSVRERLWGLPSESLSVRMKFRYPLGGEHVFASALIPNVTHFDAPALATTLFLYHELFHAFQESAFAPADVDADAMFDALARGILRSPPEVAEQQRFRERSLLLSAILAGSHEETRAKLAEYYAQLDERAPRVVRAGEEHAERIEGTATFFGYQAAARALHLADGDVLHWVSRDLTQQFPEDIGRGEAGLENWHMYAAGTAKAMLVSRLVANWQGKIAEGKTLDDLLISVVEASHAPQ